MKKLVIVLLVLGMILECTAQKKKRKDHLITLNTSYGTMRLVLFDQTPKHKENFLKLVKEGFYNNLLFHRVIKNFMIQGGDPDSRNAEPNKPLGSGGVGYKIPAELVPSIIHKKGTLAAARDNNPQKASNGCQFYIVQGQVWNDADFDRQAARSGQPYTTDQRKVYQTIGGTPHLDGNYTVFGEVIDGLSVIDSIAKQSCDTRNRPTKDIKMSMTSELVRLRKIHKKYGYTF